MPVHAQIERVLPQGLYQVVTGGGERVFASLALSARTSAAAYRPGHRVVLKSFAQTPHRGEILGPAHGPLEEK